MLTVPARNPPNQALNSTAGKNVMKGTAMPPIKGVSAARSSVATIVAMIAAPYLTDGGRLFT